MKLHYLNRSRGDLYCMAMGAWDPHVMAHFEWMDALCVSSVDFPLVSEFDLNFPYLDNRNRNGDCRCMAIGAWNQKMMWPILIG